MDTNSRGLCGGTCWSGSCLGQGGVRPTALDFALLAPRVMELMERYANVPMSFADACLVALAESTPGARLFTLDRDFLIYRQNNDQPLTLLAPFVQ